MLAVAVPPRLHLDELAITCPVCTAATPQTAADPLTPPPQPPPQTQVRHFDELQENEVRAAKRLHAEIQHKAATSAGNLAGAAQS
jgi:hypothetical protein